MAAQKDYYADLGMPRDADIETIKKQYRKLALKYHPDRNNGNEDEAIAKFQIIQEAHEVLSDPTSKAKYDATLGKSRYTGASGVRGNPWADVGQQFPTPPRRTTTARNATSGAQRWQTRFSSGVPPTAKQTFGSDPNAKKNAAKAFENMRKNARGEPRPSEPPPPPPRQPPRTESARQRQEASFGSRKSGYYPRSTMPGDEPAVSNANYTNSERRNVPQPPPRKPVPNPMPDPLSQFRDQGSSSESRQGTPYTSGGGEKTDPFAGVPLGRAKSARDFNQVDGGTATGDKLRSSSVPRRQTQEELNASLRVPTDGDRQSQSADDGIGAYTNTSTKSHTDAKFNADPTSRTAEPCTDATDNKNGPSMYETPCDHQRNKQSMFSTYPGLTEFDIVSTSPTTGLDSSDAVHKDRSPSGRECGSVTFLSYERQQTNILNNLINNKEGLLRPRAEEETTSSTHDHRDTTKQAQAANQPPRHRFSFPMDDDTFAESPTAPGGHAFAKTGFDDINTSFVKDESSNNTYRFNAGAGEGDANVGIWSSPRGQRARRSQIKRPSMHDSNSANTTSNATQAESGFNPQGWSDKFNAQTFVPQPQSGPSTSPTRASRTNSRKTKIKPTTGTAATVDDSSSEEETYEWRGRNAQAQGGASATDSPQPMDIDSPMSSGATATQPARNIHVEPSRPEWRPGKVAGGVTNDEKPERPAKLPLDPNATGSEDSEEFRASFADLRNVAPFSQQSEGLECFNGMKDNLPFESKASDVPPVKGSKSVPLEFPSTPLAPRLPPTVAIDGMKPNTTSWMRYIADFESYLRQWDSFNCLVVDHFATRKSLIENTRANKGYTFLAARGDADLQEYYSWVQQDNDVRRRWNDACEQHETRVREFIAFREKMKDGRA
ncbi:DnaJ domain protein [Metarhizium rileyi]|uniref:DnaJ domain protein n=1 Tax=Metarhizium rileyi (strain RCEF 4871) TaxID=1649241 RepID=A0A167HAY9_METRR|nr:DnaJ domain protein [Metarhizium rileyi RCEF 4871]